MYVATDLLRDQQQSIAHVTAQTGYQSEASFSRAFKRVMGHPPSAARRSAASAAALH
ncbi:MAG: helix-turn-helix domain-containing protein [Acidimicrobiales bacterium]